MKIVFYVFTGGRFPLDERQAALALAEARKLGWTGDDLPPHYMEDLLGGSPVRFEFETPAAGETAVRFQ